MPVRDKKREQIMADLKPILVSGEQLLDATTCLANVRRMGKTHQRRGTLFVTDRRVGIFTKKLGGHDSVDFAYGLLTSVQYKKGVIFGEIQMLASGDSTEAHQIQKDEVERIAQTIRQRVAMAHDHANQALPSAPAPSTADELGKLAELRKQGVLNDEEFDAQKAKLLGQ